jgi:hypothetical protein
MQPDLHLSNGNILPLIACTSPIILAMDLPITRVVVMVNGHVACLRSPRKKYRSKVNDVVRRKF